MSNDERTRFLDMIKELADVATWFQAFYNDVAEATPEYFMCCGDLDALQYLLSESQYIEGRARILIEVLAGDAHHA